MSRKNYLLLFLPDPPDRFSTTYKTKFILKVHTCLIAEEDMAIWYAVLGQSPVYIIFLQKLSVAMLPVLIEYLKHPHASFAMETSESCKLITNEQPGYPAICKKLSYAVLAIDCIYAGYHFKIIGT